MSAFGWLYLAGEVLTLVATLWTCGRPRSMNDAVAAMFMAVFWPVTWLACVVLANGDTDQ